jgi:hypothetical protein
MDQSDFFLTLSWLDPEDKGFVEWEELWDKLKTLVKTTEK